VGERHCERVMTHSMLSVQPTASGKLRRLTASHCNSRCWSSYGWFRSPRGQVSAETVIRPFLFAVTETIFLGGFGRNTVTETEFRSVSSLVCVVVAVCVVCVRLSVCVCEAFNTFIDDVFAFIITMPTAHRLACFRDDIVFLIYLYQRWYVPSPTARSRQ